VKQAGDGFRLGVLKAIKLKRVYEEDDVGTACGVSSSVSIPRNDRNSGAGTLPNSSARRKLDPMHDAARQGTITLAPRHGEER